MIIAVCKKLVVATNSVNVLCVLLCVCACIGDGTSGVIFRKQLRNTVYTMQCI